MFWWWIRVLTRDNGSSETDAYAFGRPTNFLDAETLAVLTHSLRAFKGAVLTVSHHEAFVRVLCNEAWDMKDGCLTVTILKEKMKVGGAMSAAKAEKTASSQNAGGDGEDEE